MANSNKYPENIISIVNKSRVADFNNLYPSFDFGNAKELLDNMNGKAALDLIDCGGSSRRNDPPPKPEPKVAYEKIIGEAGVFLDQDGRTKTGMLFNCNANKINILHYDEITPVFGQTFYGKYRECKYTKGNNEDYFLTPSELLLRVGDTYFSTTEDGPFITGQTQFSSEFWIQVNEEQTNGGTENLNLSDNKGSFEFILFFYSELSLELIVQKLRKNW